MRSANSHLVVGVIVGDFECGHCTGHGLNGSENVLEDQLCEGPAIFLGVAAPMDDSHLFDEGGLAALPCA